MTTSEPTTGEIVRALRYCTDENSICGTACPAYLSEAGCRTTVIKNAADRLESQEREIERLRKMNHDFGEFHERFGELTSKKYVEDICALTARAEQAEKERDALVKSVDRLVEAWKNFKSPALIELVKQWRGLPQDGEGK